MSDSKKLYEVVTACYGGRRGTTVGAIAQEYATALVQERAAKSSDPIYSKLEVRVLGRGNPKFMEGKVDHPIEAKHLDALRKASESMSIEKKPLDQALETLASTGRKPASPEELQRVQRVYAADEHLAGLYQKLAGEESNPKYSTFLQGAKMAHSVHGVDLDDTETSVDFTNRVIIPKIKGGTPADLKSGDSQWVSLDGEVYRAGDENARLREARDLILVAQHLATGIVEEAYQEAERELRTEQPPLVS